MQEESQIAPAFSRRWTVAGIAAATVAIAGAALSWHGHAHAFGPGQHGPGGREQVDRETMGGRIAALTAYRLAGKVATPGQQAWLAEPRPLHRQPRG